MGIHCRGDVEPGSNEPAEGENCNGQIQATYSITGTYSHTTGWNIGGQFGTKLPASFLGKVVSSLAPEIKVSLQLHLSHGHACLSMLHSV